MTAELSETAAPPQPAADPAERHPPFGLRFVLPLALGSTLNPVNSTMIATALVPIAADFHASVAETGWLIAGLYLASAIAQPTMGRLADLFGPRRIYLIALFLVAAAGVLGRFSPSLGSLVVARVILGIGTSGAYPSAMRIFRVQADRIGSEPPRVAMGFLSLAALSSAAIGPLIGGVLTDAFGWHSIFTVNIPLALGTALLVLLWTPKDQPRQAGFARLLRELDLIGIGLFAAFLFGLMVFLMNLDRPIWWVLPIAAVFGIALVLHSLLRAQPFIDVRMLARNVPLAVTYTRAAALSMIVYCIVYGFAQWLEGAAGFSSSKAGLVMLPISAVAALSSLVGARTKGIRWPFIVSIGSALAGCIGLLCITSATPAWIIAAVVVLFSLPQGMFSTATQAAVYIQAPAREIGTAAGLQRTAQYIGAIAGTSLLGLLYGQHATDHGFHSLAAVMGVLSAVLFIVTLFDRTLPRGRV
jgi:MFS family permease